MTPKGLQKLMKIYSCTFEELIQAESELERNALAVVQPAKRDRILTAGGLR